MNIGNGKMDYIKNLETKKMMTNAWQAIMNTNNWDFMKQNIESFSNSSDPRIHIITREMEKLGYRGHSGCSFGLTMRAMQYLARRGEDDFKDYIKPSLNVGDGNMDYICSEHDRQILENAWKAITFTNSWDFIREKNIYDELSSESLKEISDTMVYLGYNGHSGLSFLWAINAMRYLLINGEEKYKDVYG